MRILLLGAGGFIGRHILAELLGAGHDVIGVARSTGDLAVAFPEARFVALDLTNALRAEDWHGHLDGIDLVINAAGVLRGPDLEPVHVAMPRALCAAAEAAKIRRVVLISAISARPDVATDYAATKLAGEAVLRASALDWVILRPSLVYGDGSYGGTSLMRGMAGWPLVVPLLSSGGFAFTPIHVRDLARTVRITCESPALSRRTLEPVGPDTLSLRDILARYRAWLGFGRVRFLPMPMALMRLMGRIGDWAGDGPISTTSLKQTVAGNAGDSAAFASAIGFTPRSLDSALRDHPAEVQDRWHARLFFLIPLLWAALIVLWLGSAVAGWINGAAETNALLGALHLPLAWSDPLRIGSGLLDIAIAVWLLTGKALARVTLLQLAVVLGYTLVLGVALPRLWLDPLGALLKNLPILLAIAIHGSIGVKR